MRRVLRSFAGLLMSLYGGQNIDKALMPSNTMKSPNFRNEWLTMALTSDWNFIGCMKSFMT